MPKRRRTEADFQTFLLGLTAQSDEMILNMAVMNRVVVPRGPYGDRTRVALTAEAARRGLGVLVDTLANAAIAQGAAMVEGEEDAD